MLVGLDIVWWCIQFGQGCGDGVVFQQQVVDVGIFGVYQCLQNVVLVLVVEIVWYVEIVCVVMGEGVVEKFLWVQVIQELWDIGELVVDGIVWGVVEVGLGGVDVQVEGIIVEGDECVQFFQVGIGVEVEQWLFVVCGSGLVGGVGSSVVLVQVGYVVVGVGYQLV